MRAAVLRRLRGSRRRLIYRSPSRSNRPMIGPLGGDLIGDVRQIQALIVSTSHRTPQANNSARPSPASLLLNLPRRGRASLPLPSAHPVGPSPDIARYMAISAAAAPDQCRSKHDG